MKTLIITDLSISHELGQAEMAAVVGGFGADVYAQYMSSLPSLSAPKAPQTTFNAAQSLGQSQNTTVNNGNNAAFVCGISAHVNPSQNGANSINFG